jgi:hypothetical protein
MSLFKKRKIPITTEYDKEIITEYDKVIKLCKMLNISGELNIIDIVPEIPNDSIFIPSGQHNLFITNVNTKQNITISSYNLRSSTIDQLKEYINNIIKCIEDFLRGINKKIIHINQDGKQAYVIVDNDNSINENNWVPNQNDAQVTFSVNNIDRDYMSELTKLYKKRARLILETLQYSTSTIKQLHIGWVNGMAHIKDKPRIPGLGLLILFYAMLKSYLQYDFLIKSSLDNDSDYNDTYDILGFTYDSGVYNKDNGPEMSSSLNIEKIINDILPVICNMHQTICDCIDDSKQGGKIRIKKRKSKKRKTRRRKTRRRRKY